MSIWAQGLTNQVNAYVRNYPLEAFQNKNLNAILLQLIQQIDNLIGGGPITMAGTLNITQANFVNATDCPLVNLAGQSLCIFMNDIPRYLKKGVEWQDYPGGGFSIIKAGDFANFDATANNYQFYVSIQGN